MKERLQSMSKIEPYILSIDTSCDDTSVAVLRGRKVLSSVVSSQVELHKKWGGTVPMIAKLAHQENIEPAYKEALKRAKLKIEDINYIAVTKGPGLAIALEVGISFAKNKALENQIPLIPVNHMEGHLLSSLALNKNGKGNIEEIKKEKLFPALGILVSGKNTEIIYLRDFCDYTQIGQTLDDAAGECFDKVGRMLNLGYPGGPFISELAKKGNSRIMQKIKLPIPLKYTKDYNFSFSGLKTACLLAIQKLRSEHKSDREWVNDFCFAFVETVIQTVENKLTKAFNNHKEVKSLFIGGGVINNEKICLRLGRLATENNVRYYLPDVKYRSDNAAMIGISAYFQIQKGLCLNTQGEIESLDRDPVLEI